MHFKKARSAIPIACACAFGIALRLAIVDPGVHAATQWANHLGSGPDSQLNRGSDALDDALLFGDTLFAKLAARGVYLPAVTR